MAFLYPAEKLPPVAKSEKILDSMSSYLFSFAITKEAVYLRSGGNLGRFPRSAIRKVTLDPARERPGAMIICGLISLALGIGIWLRWPTSLFQWSMAILSISFFVLAMRRDRGGWYRLWIDLAPGFPTNFNSVEPLSGSRISAKEQAAALEAQMRFLEACQRVGLRVIDNRAPVGAS